MKSSILNGIVKVIRYLLFLLYNTVSIYILSLCITGVILYFCVHFYHRQNDAYLNDNIILNKRLFERIFLILITIFTLCITLYQNYNSQQYNNKESIKYEKKLHNAQVSKYIVYYDSRMLSYFHRNKKHIKRDHVTYYRLYSNSRILNSYRYNRHPMNKLINKNNKVSHIPNTIFIRAYRHKRFFVIEPKYRENQNKWKYYKLLLELTKNDYQKSSIFFRGDIYLLKGYRYSVYKAKRIKMPKEVGSTHLFSRVYRIYKLPKMKSKYGLQINNVPKYIYLSRKTNTHNVRHSQKYYKKYKRHRSYKISKFSKLTRNYLITSIAKYVDACNFQIFIQFLVNLICIISFDLWLNLCTVSYYMFEYLSVRYIFFDNDYVFDACDDISYMFSRIKSVIKYNNLGSLIKKSIYQLWEELCSIYHLIIKLYSIIIHLFQYMDYKKLFYYINLIINKYVFKLMPLVIAVMSGMFAMETKHVTSNLFEILIRFTIPLLSSIQFLRLMFHFYGNENKRN